MGRSVGVEEVERGVWLARTAEVIPDNERWLDTPEANATPDRGCTVTWAFAGN